MMCIKVVTRLPAAADIPDSSWQVRSPRARMARQELPRRRFVCRRAPTAAHVTDRTRGNATTLIRA
jgi:hypothetical protein